MKTQQQHTPGPWLFKQQGDTWRIDSRDGKRVLAIDCGLVPSNADARLMCTATKLLAALEWSVSQLDDSLDPDFQASLKAAQFVINEAKGSL